MMPFAIHRNIYEIAPVAIPILLAWNTGPHRHLIWREVTIAVPVGREAQCQIGIQVAIELVSFKLKGLICNLG